VDKTKRVFKIHTAWNIEKEIRWLEHMALTAWHLEHYAWGFYWFRQSAPVEEAFELDFALGKDREMMIGLYRDAGWRHITSFANWHYFCADGSADTHRPAYTDVASKKAKLTRVLTVLMVSILPMVWFGMVNPVVNGYLAEYRFYYGIFAFAAIMTSICLYGALRLLLRIRQMGRP